MSVRDINPLPDGEKIIIPFDGQTPSGTDIDGLLGGFLSKLAQNHRNFPINFEKWPDVPSGYKDAIFIISSRYTMTPCFLVTYNILFSLYYIVITHIIY